MKFFIKLGISGDTPEVPETPPTENAPLHRGTATEIEETHQYIYAGGKLLRETISDGTTTKTLDFTYDNVGMPYSLIYNNGTTATTYYYVTNLQGDVMYLVDASGNEVAAYDYDPYGKIISATGDLAEINPLRYRGYYYDTETSFYYLQSRYYDPEICRFINADSYASTGQGLIGLNTFAYCNNSPIQSRDRDGRDVEILVVEEKERVYISDVVITITLSVKYIADEENGGNLSVQFAQNASSVSISAGGQTQTYDISLNDLRSSSYSISFYEKNTGEMVTSTDFTLSQEGAGVSFAVRSPSNIKVSVSVSVNPVPAIIKHLAKRSAINIGAIGGYSPMNSLVVMASGYYGRTGPSINPFGRDVVCFH